MMIIMMGRMTILTMIDDVNDDDDV